MENLILTKLEMLLTEQQMKQVVSLPKVEQEKFIQRMQIMSKYPRLVRAIAGRHQRMKKSELDKQNKEAEKLKKELEKSQKKLKT